MRQLKKFPDLPVSTREEHQKSQHNSRRAPVFPPHPERSPFPCFVRKGSPALPLQLKEWWSKLDTREELQGSCHHFQRPQCPNALQIHLTPLQDSTVTPRTDSKHNGGYDSPEALQKKATDPYVNMTGSQTLFSGEWTCMSLHETRPDSPVETREEP